MAVGKEKQTELVFGVHAIEELLKAKRRRITVIYTTKPQPKAWHHIEKALPRGTQIQYVTREALNKLAGTTDHQGIIALATPFEYRKKMFEPEKQRFLLLLDSIQDPRNVGAMIRSAYCTGVDGVILVEKGASPLTAAALKASAGLAEHMQIYRAPSAIAAAQELKHAGYALYMAMVDKKSERADTVNYSMPLCLVIGNEGTGISSDVAKQGQSIYVPQRNPDISYNASVAAGILLFLISTKSQII